MKSWEGLNDVSVPTKPRRTQVSRCVLTATFATIVILAGLDTIFPGLKNWAASFYNEKSNSKEPGYSRPFDWSEVTPQKNLEFHKCYPGFECAKLSLPLDYFNGTYPDETVSIAIVKLPAKVPVDDPRYGGPILLNPGGPGGSGALFALGIGESLQTVVDSDVDPSIASADAKYFDLIGFDPRGIGLTEPVAQCLADKPSFWSWNLRESDEGILGSSDAALGRLWSMTHAFGTSCKQAMDAEDGPDIKQYVSTAFVARDMLEITEKHAEYVAKKVAQLSAHKAGKRLGCYDTKYTPGEAKLQYWGFSYGTYLGSTFASMFPDRIGRAILDGVVSSYDYRHALGNGSLTDTEKVMNSFYTFCQSAGPVECPLAITNGTITDVKQRFDSILESLYHSPLAINSADGPEILTWSDVKELIFSSLYGPQFAFQFLATILAEVEQGGGPILDQLSRDYRYAHVYSCPVNGSDYTPITSSIVPTIAVLCSDGIDQTHVAMDDFVDYWKQLDTMSPTGGSYWSMLGMRCAAWKLRASYTFEGPFGANTSHPILFISNTADPVTPLRSGRLMHNMFPGSALLIQDSAGHCSLSTPVPCMLTHVRRYFQTGALPLPGTVCVPPASPFSLNSTDPKSPFYDPSLGSVNVVSLEFDEFDEAQSVLHEVGREVQRFVARSDGFGFQKVRGSEKVRSGMMIAAEGSFESML